MKKKYTKEQLNKRIKDSKRKHYLKNKNVIDEKASLKRNEARKRNIDFVNNYKLKNPCANCGETRLPCLSFHHKEEFDKEKCIKQLKMSPVSLEKLKDEISKCEVLCENCHRKLHELDWNRNEKLLKVPKRSEDIKKYQSIKRKNSTIIAKNFVYNLKLNSKCSCGEDHPASLEFHHTRDKKMNISRMVANGNGLDTLREEIEKCEIICANCHRAMHSEEK